MTGEPLASGECTVCSTSPEKLPKRDLRLDCDPQHLACTQFWELDSDHDFVITKDDLIKYGNHSLTYRIVDRIFQQVASKHYANCFAIGPLNRGRAIMCFKA